MAGSSNEFLRAETVKLLQGVGVPEAAQLSQRLEKTIRGYVSDKPEDKTKFLPIDAVAMIESKAIHPYLTNALIELRNASKIESDFTGEEGWIGFHIARMSADFARLMGYCSSINHDGPLSPKEAKKLLMRILELQSSLADVKRFLVLAIGEQVAIADE